MLISVDLPAPFSPSRAWISPRRSWRSTASLAVSAPKRLVMPRSSSASPAASASDGDTSANVRPASLLDGVGHRDGAGREVRLHLVDLVLVLGPGRRDLADARALVLDVERGVRVR